ncbi:MAG: NAD-dependent epimerase/dehydratase family protein, partial [Pseudomonadota bacterium]
MNALVTGGGGFLGKAVVTRLLDRGDDVISFSRGDYPELRRLGAQVIRGDLADSEAVDSAAQGCDVVFHVAAKAGVWGRREEYFRTNVLGAQNIVSACLARHITRLVYTSSPSVVYDGRNQ